MSGFDDVYRIVRAIPRGKVMTYGQIADRVDRPLSARVVGWAMSQCPEDVPWHRVVNASGRCSVDGDASHGRQRRLLEKEGVVFGGESIDLTRFRFVGLSATADEG